MWKNYTILCLKCVHLITIMLNLPSMSSLGMVLPGKIWNSIPHSGWYLRQMTLKFSSILFTSEEGIDVKIYVVKDGLIWNTKLLIYQYVPAVTSDHELCMILLQCSWKFTLGKYEPMHLHFYALKKARKSSLNT